MDETPINLENILEQAPKWTFAGDFTLLQWMNQISQDLETRATKTTEALDKLHNNVRSTNIALDNVANSLTTLQFGNQFVECRVQDDDETLSNANEASGIDSNNPIESTLTSKEILNKFLDNNLKVLRNCHEKYSIDLDDSDEDEDEEGKYKEKTCIYQPINPYNEKPLPFIFGSKDWHAKWHVGLYENQQENNYSGDEISEAFSESSSTSHLDDNESFESNTEWASSNSIDNDNLNTNIEVKNASTLRGSQTIPSVTPSIPISVAKNKTTISESSSLSTPSSSFAKKPVRSTKQTENLTERSESKNSLNSKISSKDSNRISANTQRNPPIQYKQQPPPFVDLFAEPPDDLESTTSSSVSSAQNILSQPDNNRSISTERPSAFRTQPPPFVDLFAEPPEDIPSSTTSSSISSGRNVKRKTVNLFDDDEDDLTKDDLLTTLTKKEDSVATKADDKKTLTPAKPTVIEKPLTKTPKSLFEDSDGEDDDFLKAFAQRSTSTTATKSSLTKTLLFDNEFQEPSLNTNSTKTIGDTANLITDSQVNKAKPKIRNIFNDTDDNEDDLFVNKTEEKSKSLQQKAKIEDDSKLVKVSANIIPKKSVNLFDDSDNLDTENIKKSVNIFDDFEDKPKPEKLTNKTPKKINLFDDLDDDEGDDLFSIKPKQTSVKEIPTERNLKQNKVKSLAVTNKEINTETIVKEIPASIATESSLNDNEEKSLNVTNKEIRKESIVRETLANISAKSSFKENEVKSLEVTKKLVETESIVEKTDTNNVSITSKEKNDSNDIKEKSNKQLIPEDKDNVLDVKVNNIFDNKENKEREQTKIYEQNDENLMAKETTTTAETPEIQTESTNIETKTKIPIELNNNESISIIQEKTITAAANESQTSNTSNKYDFNSMLLFDEPPEDDNEFFETLTKTPQALNSNYNAIDLEHDLYEPELPKVPVTSASNNQTDSTETKQTSLYTGLQLFSDIPPDDDASDIANHPPDANSTKRLHSVFYDDFNETLMALNQNQVVKDISAHSIFSDEPPPINEDLSSLSSKDTIDHKVPDVKQVETSSTREHKLKGSEIAAKLEETLSKSVDKSDTASTTTKRPVSKLQMPHININVQALLPGANNTLRKTKADTTKSNVIDQGNDNDENPVVNISPTSTKLKEANTLTKPLAEVPRTSETEHILPSVTKNRVRGPAARRPSTRRARQENYRKSMLEEPSAVESEDERKELQSKDQYFVESAKTQINSNVKSSPKEVQTKNNKEIQKEIVEKINQETLKDIQTQNNKEIPKQIVDKAKDDISKTNKSKHSAISNLFDDKQQDQSNISNLSKSTTMDKKIETKSLKEETPKALEIPASIQINQNLTIPAPTINKTIEKDHSNILKQNQSTSKKDEIKEKPAQTKISLLFDDEEDDDDDDLFKHIKTTKTITKEKDVKLQSDSKKSSSNLFANKTNIPVTKEIPKPSTSNADLVTSTTKPDNKTPQPIKHDDNLPSKSHSNIQSNQSNLIKTKTEITKKPSFLDEEEDDDDLFKSSIQNTKPNIQKPNNSKTFEERNRIAKSKFKSFLDSESDEDPTVAGLQQTTTKPSTHTVVTASSNKIPNITIPATKQSNAKLFSDSDTDSDDLFGKLSSTKPSKTSMQPTTKSQSKAQTKSSLFSDESDADDIPTSSKSASKNIVSKSSSKVDKPKSTVQTNTSLFSDVDSDEDDLFGSGSAKVTTKVATNIPNTKTTVPATSKPIASTAEITKTKTVADNPLADLL